MVFVPRGRVMRTAFLMTFLAVTSSSSIAGWVLIGEQGAYASYVDSGTAEKNGTVVRMWNLVDAKVVQTTKTGGRYMSAKAQSEYDCAGRKTRLISFSLHAANMGEGAVISSESGRGKWAPAPTDKNSLWKIACERR
jgi:hypothetical protein